MHWIFNYRNVIKVAGESGQGVNSLGSILTKALCKTGYHIFGYREYPSLIKGGHASYQIDISDKEIKSSSAKCQLLVCTSRSSVHAYLMTLADGGILIHSQPRLIFTPEETAFIHDHRIEVIHLEAREMSKAAGGNELTANMVLLGFTWQLLGLDLETLNSVVSLEFADKPKVLEADVKCLAVGYEFAHEQKPDGQIDIQAKPKQEHNLLVSGNEALSLGVISAGVRAYFSYPMTPSSDILTYLAETSHETGMLIKQAEDEITAAQMAVGSMYMGTRALVATSGGGFDLMTETLSLAGMLENPFVAVIGQRPGPATGLPTWTSSGDLNLAVYAGHGEFARCVLAASDAESAHVLIQKAFNISEKFQIPVILLTEKQIAESTFNIRAFPPALSIERNLAPEFTWQQLKPEDRYKDSTTGISIRWLPGESDATFDANSDEHWEDGSITEEADKAQVMMEKRMKKYHTLLAEIPEPTEYGHVNADISFIGWGSVKNTIQDVISLASKQSNLPKINYLHFDHIYPLKTDRLKEFVYNNKKIVLIENNYQGQLGKLISQEIGYQFEHKLLKYDGRPFFIEDILHYVGNNE
jgi:2-oxoglutarate ferredoxin oxidoreductase subunit alpha